MILVCVPTYETICPETFKSIWECAVHTNYSVMFEFIKGYDCALARNKAVAKALEQNAEYIFFVDSDIIVPKEAILHMMQPPVDICLGIYPRKNTGVGQTEIFKCGYKDFTDKNNYSISDFPKQDRIGIKGGGLGCALIKTSIFKALPSPWFKYVQYDNGQVLSEDLYFCWNAAEAGFDIEVDTRVRCGHLVRTFQYE